MLALSFLLLIGVALIADGFDFHIPRGYIYFAMAFAAVVEGSMFWRSGGASGGGNEGGQRPTCAVAAAPYDRASAKGPNRV